MIGKVDIGVSDASRRAEIIYAQARSQIDVRLWRAALGGSARTEPDPRTADAPRLALATILGLFTSDRPARPASPLIQHMAQIPAAAKAAVPTPAAIDTVVAAHASAPTPAAAQVDTTTAGLGRNGGFANAIASAASRAGIPAAVLASIIEAEAAKSRDGRWLATSKNGRSTATGLGQFLAGTWKSEAERAGTWLNATARSNGWIGAGGKVPPDAQAALLALRNDSEASINATADLARHSLGQLARAGVAIGQSVEQIAKAAYLGHNLGIGDAISFLRGGLSEGRARHLLDAQVGSAAAARRIANTGSAGAAHHSWLTEFMDRRLNTHRFFADQ